MWTCRRCGSSERRPGGKGCAECNRRYQRDRRTPVDDSDIVITPAIRAYLAAFDAFVLARRDGDSAATRRAQRARERLLRVLEDL